MAEKDYTEKRLENFNDVFSDIINVLVFDGQEEVKENDLINAMPRSAYILSKDFAEQERDCVKYWKNNDIRIAMFGLENQTNVDDDFVFRCISYDGAEYRDQIRTRNNIRKNNRNLKKKCPEIKDSDLRKVPDYYPVITIGLYFSDHRWSGITSLRDKLSLPESIRGFVPDYRVNMIEVAYLTDKQVNSFKSDFKYVAEYFVENRRQKEGLKPRFNFSPIHVKHIEEFLELMKSITGNEKVYNTYLDAIQNEGGAVQIMESIFDRYEAKGMAIGEIKGTIKVYYDEMKLSPTEINQKIIKRFNLNPDDAEKYIEETLKPV